MFEIALRTDLELEIMFQGQLLKGERRYDCTRNVFLFPDFVVKFSDIDDDNGEFQNNSEFDFFQNYLMEEHRKFFPVLLHHKTMDDGDIMLVFERVFPDNKKVLTEQEWREGRDLIEFYNIGDLQFMKSNELCSNCMITSEGLKIYDVGFSVA